MEKTQEKITIQVLVTTMHQNDLTLYSKMNLQTNAVIANQADTSSFIEEEINGHRVKMITTDTRGASKNRNIAMLYSKADIIVFADDDQVFVDGYEKIILDAFEEQKDADAIKFYCESTNPERPMAFKKPKGFIRAKKASLMSAGVHGLAVYKDVLERNNIIFKHDIGPGTDMLCGEDTVFLSQMCAMKIKIYSSPTLISYINQGESSWFKGYTEQYFISLGYIYAHIYGRLAIVASIRRALRMKNKKDNSFSVSQMIKLMRKGIKKQRKDN